MPTSKAVKKTRCPEYDSSGPFLDDVTKQADENFHAQREGRKPEILKRACRWCGDPDGH